jgi:predicted RNase H-like HicB family nuclease
MKSNNGYTYRVIFEEDEDGYHAYAPALTGCHTWGKNLQEAKTNIREAIRAYIGSLKKDNEQIPQDNGLETFEAFSLSDFQNAPA